METQDDNGIDSRIESKRVELSLLQQAIWVLSGEKKRLEAEIDQLQKKLAELTG